MKFIHKHYRIFLLFAAISLGLQAGIQGAVSAVTVDSASAQGRWLNEAQIELFGTSGSSNVSYIFTDSNPADLTYEYLYAEANGCFSKITLNSMTNPVFGEFSNVQNSTSNSECTYSTKSIVLRDDQNSNKKATATQSPYSGVTFLWVDSATISMSGSQTGSFRANEAGTTFERQSDPDNCKDTITAVSQDKKTATLNVKSGTRCETSTPQGITFVGNTVANAENEPGEEVLEDTAAGCDNALSPFGWILCPIIDLADEVYAFFVNLVREALFFEPEKYNNSDLQDASRIFVNFANILLIIFSLLMIVSQIFGFEVFSAYTVKKVLPRIIIGAILIQLSWPLFTMFIQLVNALGTGLYWLVLAPFGLTSGSGYVELNTILAINSTEELGDVVANAGGTVLGLGAIAGAIVGISLAGAWLTILLAALGILVGLIIAILTLVVREVVLILLLVLAPLALALWIFPGTQRYWTMWWQNFSKLLLMYPLIMLLLAGGTIAAAILSGTGNDEEGINLNKIFAIIAYFAPLFLIGATFKFAGQAFGSIANISNKYGSKLNGTRFGLGNQAKMRRENSALSNVLGNRRENLSKKLQDRSAARITGTGQYDKGIKGIYSRSVQRASSGLINANEDNLIRAQSRAGNQIRSEEEKAYKNRSDLVDFQVNETAKRLIRENSSLGNVDQYAIERQVRAAMISGSDTFTPTDLSDRNGNAVNVTLKDIPVNSGLRADAALSALKNKDNTAALNSYVSSVDGFNTLKDRGTEDRAAWAILQEKLGTAAKGAKAADFSAVNIQIDPTTNKVIKFEFPLGFDDGISNFGKLGGLQQEQIGDALQQGLIHEPEKAKAMITDIVRDRSVSNEALAKLEVRTGMAKNTLLSLRSDQNSKL